MADFFRALFNDAGGATLDLYSPQIGTMVNTVGFGVGNSSFDEADYFPAGDNAEDTQYDTSADSMSLRIDGLNSPTSPIRSAWKLPTPVTDGVFLETRFKTAPTLLSYILLVPRAAPSILGPADPDFPNGLAEAGIWFTLTNDTINCDVSGKRQDAFPDSSNHSHGQVFDVTSVATECALRVEVNGTAREVFVDDVSIYSDTLESDFSFLNMPDVWVMLTTFYSGGGWVNPKTEIVSIRGGYLPYAPLSGPSAFWTKFVKTVEVDA